MHLYIFLRHTCTLHLLVLSSIVEIILVMLLFAVEQLLWIFRIERLRKDRLLLFQSREQVRMNTKKRKRKLNAWRKYEFHNNKWLFMRHMHRKESRYTYLRVNGEIMPSSKTNFENRIDEESFRSEYLPYN